MSGSLSKMRAFLLLALGFFSLQITLTDASGSRLVEKEIDVHLAADDKYLDSGLAKPLRLSGYFKVTIQLSSHAVHNTHGCLLGGEFD